MDHFYMILQIKLTKFSCNWNEAAFDAIFPERALVNFFTLLVETTGGQFKQISNSQFFFRVRRIFATKHQYLRQCIRKELRPCNQNVVVRLVVGEKHFRIVRKSDKNFYLRRCAWSTSIGRDKGVLATEFLWKKRCHILCHSSAIKRFLECANLIEDWITFKFKFFVKKLWKRHS